VIFMPLGAILSIAVLVLQIAIEINDALSS
jgi:hypothetical protein